MLDHIARHWWILLVRGICAILFGIAAFAWPGITLFVLVFLFGIQAVIDGVAAIALGVRMKRTEHEPSWGAMVLTGVASLLAGIVAMAWPGITAVALLYLIAFWAIVRGLFEIMAAIRLRKAIDNEWMLGLAGALSVLFGIMLIAWPGAGLLSMVWLIGASAIAFGVLAVMLSFRVKRLGSRIAQAA